MSTDHLMAQTTLCKHFSCSGTDLIMEALKFIGKLSLSSTKQIQLNPVNTDHLKIQKNYLETYAVTTNEKKFKTSFMF